MLRASLLRTPEVRLRNLAGAYGCLLRACRGDMRRAVGALGGEFVAPHLDAGRIRRVLAAVAFPADKLEALCEVASFGISPPISGRTTGFDDARWQFCGRRHAPDERSHLLNMLAAEESTGHCFVLHADVARSLLPNLVVSPVYLVPKREPGKYRRIIDLTYCAGVGDSINSATDMAAGPVCEFARAFERHCAELYALRLGHPNRHIYQRADDVHAAFRQMRFDPAHAPMFSYRLAGLVVVDLRGAFGWRLTPGFFDLFAQAIQYQVRAARPGAPTSAAARAIAATRIRIDRPPPGTKITTLPPDPSAEALVLGDDSPYNVNYHVDDGVMADVRDEATLRHRAAVLIDAHFALFGGHEPHLRPCPISLSKMGNWSTKAVILGVVIDTASMSLSLPADKRARLTSLLFREFPPSRRTASVRDVQVLIGSLRFLALVVRPGKYFLSRLQEACGCVNGLPPTTMLSLRSGFHDDLRWWRWLVGQVELTSVSLAMPLWMHVTRPPCRRLLSDASKWGMGGYCEELGMFWQLPLPDDLVARFNGDNCDAVYINEMELAGMVLNAYMLLILGDGAVAGESVLVLGDNMTAVSRVRRAGSARPGPAGALVRILAVLEIQTGVSFRAEHVAGVDNGIADHLSREPFDPTVPSPVPASWLQLRVPLPVSETIFEMLRGSCGLERWLQTPSLSTPALGGAGWRGAQLPGSRPT